MSVGLRGCLKLLTASNFWGFGFTPSAVTICPRYPSSGLRNSHLSGYILSPSSRKHCNIIARLLLFSSIDCPNIIMSSKYTKQCLFMSPLSAVSIMRWNVAGAFFKPNGILL